MSSKNAVNPDHYKVAGRDRQGESIAARPKPRASAPIPGGPGPGQNFIPGAAPVGEGPPRTRRKPVGRQSSGEKSGLHSSAKKNQSANRGGKPPGKTRRTAGATGKARRKPTSSPSLPARSRAAR